MVDFRQMDIASQMQSILVWTAIVLCQVSNIQTMLLTSLTENPQAKLSSVRSARPQSVYFLSITMHQRSLLYLYKLIYSRQSLVARNLSSSSVACTISSHPQGVTIVVIFERYTTFVRSEKICIRYVRICYSDSKFPLSSSYSSSVAQSIETGLTPLLPITSDDNILHLHPRPILTSRCSGQNGGWIPRKNLVSSLLWKLSLDQSYQVLVTLDP